MLPTVVTKGVKPSVDEVITVVTVLVGKITEDEGTLLVVVDVESSSEDSVVEDNITEVESIAVTSETDE